jgi:hypothetical protein
MTQGDAVAAGDISTLALVPIVCPTDLWRVAASTQGNLFGQEREYLSAEYLRTVRQLPEGRRRDPEGRREFYVFDIMS